MIYLYVFTFCRFTTVIVTAMKVSCHLPVFGVMLICIHSCLAIAPFVIYEEEMWISHGQGEVHTYRTPILGKLPNGDLLAFCAPRKYSSADKSPKFIAQRRSSDGGTTWSGTRFIEDDYKVDDGLNLGAFLHDYDTNTSFIFFGYCQHTFGNCTSPYRPKGVYYKMSTDWGYTWTPAINVADANPDLKESNLAPGPGFGIQKRLAPNKGRLILCGHILDLKRRQQQCLYSDGRIHLHNTVL